MAEFVNSELLTAVTRRDTKKILETLQGNDIDLSRTDENGDTLLHLALKYASNPRLDDPTEILEIFLDRGVDINAKNRSGETIFHLACKCLCTHVIELCIRRNANLNASDNYGDTAAHLAIEFEKRCMQLMQSKGIKFSFREYVDQKEHDEIPSFVDWMVSVGVDFFYARNQNGLSALYLANEYRLYPIVFTLLKHVTDFPSVEKGLPPLLLSFFAVSSTQLTDARDGRHDGYYIDRYVPRIVEIILEKSEFISDATLLSSLRAAIAGQHQMSIIDMLLQRARNNHSLLETLFNEHLESHQGRTFAQILYSCRPRMEMLRLLKDGKADFSARDRHGRSFLHMTSEYRNDAEMIDFLMNENCDVNVTDSMGETPLHVAARKRNKNVVKALIQHGAEVDVKDNNGKTPLQLAVVDSDMVHLLLEAGADVNAKDHMGKTPLHYVRGVEVAKALFSYGAHVDILDVNGYSPLYDLLSNRSGSHKAIILQEMLKYGADIQDSKVFEFLNANPCSYGVFASIYLKKYVIKRIVTGLRHKLPFKFKFRDPKYTFLKGCQNEVESLKNYFIDDRTSLYCLLHKNRKQRCAYLNNEKLKNLVEDAAIEQKFPNYSVVILGCYNGAARTKSLLESAAHILNEVNEPFLPDLCIDKILTFLSNCDLLNFIEAFENINMSGFS